MTAIAATPSDIAYVRATHATLDQLARGRAIPRATLEAWAGRELPGPTYALADGEPWYARDWWRMYDEAGSIERVREVFAARYLAAGGPDLVGEWADYLGGFFGACLRAVTPETIVEKGRLVARLDRALGEPRPDDPAWARALRADVTALDALVQPFAACDRERFGPTSRDRLIDLPRARFPHLFAG